MEPWELMREAIKARDFAHAPYTNKKVGAALETDMGVMPGSVVENCAYPNSVCAVKSAIVTAVSSGVNQIRAVAVAGYSPDRVANLCGYCRESLAEFGDMPVYLLDGKSRIVRTDLSSLLPRVTTSDESELAGNDDNEWGKNNRRVGMETLNFKNFTLDPAQKPPRDGSHMDLMNSAILACANAYVPVSKFPVGASIKTDAGCFDGSNIENSDIMNATLCAERTAICKAVSRGAKKVEALAVVCFKLPDFGRPCGGCRQSLVEFGDFPIYQIKLDQTKHTFTYQYATSYEILPNSFNPSCLS